VETLLGNQRFIDFNQKLVIIQDYLNQKGIPFKVHGHEIILNCPFSNCDLNSKGPGHCYIQSETGVYYCQKCSEKGNLLTLAKFYGDDPVTLGFKEPPQKSRQFKTKNEDETNSPLSTEQIENWHHALPGDIRTWLIEKRGLSDYVINFAKLGWDGSRIVIPIPDDKGAWLFAKRRLAPDMEDGPKYLYPFGAKAALYGTELLLDTDEVVITEGELDALVLRSNGIISVSSTGGAGTFPEEWVPLFRNVEKIFIAYDNDEPGEKGALKVGKLLPNARIVRLPNEVGEHGDITDFFVKLGRNVDDFAGLLKSAKTAAEIEEAGQRYKPLPLPTTKTSVEEWRALILSKFPECLSAGEVGVAVLLQLLISDVRNPFGLVYVDVPSAGKTITLNFFSDLKELAYPTDSFSPASLVSHASNRKQEDLEQIDLLPRIRHKMLVVRDLAPIFAERQENLLKNLGVLTRVFDGEGYESDSGVHGKRGYRGDYTFMFLAGSTPIAPRVWKFMGNLGSRLFFLNLNVADKSEEELADLLVQDDFKRKEQECRTITRELVLTTWNRHKGGIVWDKKADPQELRKIVARCAKLLAHLRGTVNVWAEEDDGETKHQHTNTIIEKPTRINQLLYNLARGHALLCGRTIITNEDMWPIIEVTMNSAMYNRIRLLQAIMDCGGTATTDVIETALGCSNPTALKEIETLRILEVLDVEDHHLAKAGRPEKIATLKKEFEWFISEECTKLRQMKPR